MLWQSFLQKENEIVIYPWTGEKYLQVHGRSLKIEKTIPFEFGWHCFKVEGRKCFFLSQSERDDSIFSEFETGYLIGDRLISDKISASISEEKMLSLSKKVYLLDNGIDLFARIKVGKTHSDGKFIFLNQEISSGSEIDVLNAYLDKKQNLDDIKNVHPALHALFKIETWRRNEAERIRREFEEKRQEEERKLLAQKRLEELKKQSDTAIGRRELAKSDFNAAAKAALELSGAELLSAINGQIGEKTVRFRFKGSKYECVCDEKTLQIIDAGICLTSEIGVKDDKLLSLESLPPKIAEAIELGVLYIFRRI